MICIYALYEYISVDSTAIKPPFFVYRPVLFFLSTRGTKGSSSSLLRRRERRLLPRRASG